MREISQVLHVSPRTVTDMIDTLEGRGLVARCAHATDRRITLLRLTEAGARELATASTASERVAAAAISALDEDEQRTLQSLLERVCVRGGQAGALTMLSSAYRIDVRWLAEGSVAALAGALREVAPELAGYPIVIPGGVGQADPRWCVVDRVARRGVRREVRVVASGRAPGAARDRRADRAGRRPWCRTCPRSWWAAPTRCSW